MRIARCFLYVFIAVTLAVSLRTAVFAADDTSNVVSDRERQLQQQLDQVEKEIGQQQVILDQKTQERQSLERDVAILDAQIKKSQLSIQARTIAIQQLDADIGRKQGTLQALEQKLAREKNSLAELLKQTNEVDGYSLVEVALSNENVSSFFEDMDSFDSLNSALQGSFNEIRATEAATENQKSALEDRHLNEVELKNLQELEKQKVQQQEGQKKQVLTVTKGQEAAYQAVLAQKQATAAQIRAELFQLRGSAAIKFGDALAFATLAGKQTGVRPALILGTLQEETKLGQFLGTGNWKTDMHPTRDAPIFLELMKQLGLDPDAMPVSAKPSYGWGGAMGPAQFIPSTWVLYQSRIAALTGDNPPNPYNPKDAFMAAALLLADNGAAAGGRVAERTATLRYFAGGNWSNPAYAFYGDEVMGFADGFEATISQLKNLESK